MRTNDLRTILILRHWARAVHPEAAMTLDPLAHRAENGWPQFPERLQYTRTLPASGTPETKARVGPAALRTPQTTAAAAGTLRTA